MIIIKKSDIPFLLKPQGISSCYQLHAILPQVPQSSYISQQKYVIKLGTKYITIMCLKL